MKVLFVLLSAPPVSPNSMYMGLALQFKNNGHQVAVIGSTSGATQLTREEGIDVLRVHAMPFHNVPNLIKKGIGMALLPWFYNFAYSKYFAERDFDWIIMPTPSITLIDFVKRLKVRMKAKYYLILRDIHPQSSASLGEIPRKWMINYLYKRSDLAYRLADVVGCMSPANIDFIREQHNIPSTTRCVVLYNWMTFLPYKKEDTSLLRNKFGLQDKYLVLFGGNIGLGQRIENIIDLAYHYRANTNIVFVIIGTGVKKHTMLQMASEKGLENLLFLDYMPQADYLQFVKSVDLGLISINENNAAPTCPSKVISYMSLKIPVLALINKRNDYGQILQDHANAGFWAVGNDKERVYQLFDRLYTDPVLRWQMGENGYLFYKRYLTTEKAYTDMINQMIL